MLILDRGVWVKFSYNGELKDGIIECKNPVGYSVFCKDHMNEPINICSDRIKFVRLNDLGGETYYANYRLLNKYTEKKHVDPKTVFRKEFYDKLCIYDMQVEDDDPVVHYGVKRHNPQYIDYYMKLNENALKEAINKMYGYRNSVHDRILNRFFPKQVLLNGPYTTVVWEDGTHTVVKLAKGEVFDPEKAILYAIVKHMCGDVKAKMDRYLNKFDEVSIYKFKSKKEFLKELDKRDAAGDICQEYNPDEDETFFDDEEINVSEEDQNEHLGGICRAFNSFTKEKEDSNDTE